MTDPLQLSAALRAAVQVEDPELPVVALRSMEEVIADHTVACALRGARLA